MIRLNRFGDLICALPVSRSLQQKFPTAEIDWLVSPENANLAPFLRARGKIFIHERRGSRYGMRHSLLRQLQSRHYDLSIAIKGGYDPLLAWLSLAVRARDRIGYADHRPRRLAFAYTRALPPPPRSQHQVETGLDLIREIVSGDVIRDHSLEVPAANVVAIDKWLQSRGISPRKYVVFQVSSRRPPDRQWPDENFSELGRRLATAGQRVLVNGFENEAAKIGTICASIGEAAMPAIIPHLGNYLAFLSKAHLVIGTDGGGLHLAGAVGTPTIGFYTDVAPDKWRPWGEGHRQFYTAAKPAAEISVESVWQAAQEMLNG